MEKKWKNFRRQTHRWKDWDYGNNASYFVTICTYGREPYFGNIENDTMIYSEIGNKAKECWLKVPEIHPYVEFDNFTVMPNHMHSILWIRKKEISSSFKGFGSQSKNLGSIIRGFKGAVVSYAKDQNIDFKWQARFHDHVIRSKEELDHIRLYIAENVRNWKNDDLYKPR